MRFRVLVCFFFITQLTALSSEHIQTDDARLAHIGDSVQLSLSMTFNTEIIGRKDIWLLEPRLVNGSDSVSLPSIGIYGRMPYYYLVRSGNYLFQDEDDVMLRAKDLQRTHAIFYTRAHTFRPWMEGAEVCLQLIHLTCCGDVLHSEGWRILSRQEVTLPDSIVHRYFTREAHGTAHVDFVLDSIWIDPEYHDNRRELGKISHLIDSLQAEPKVHIDSVTLHGYASPEGPYHHNVWLAKNRVKALAGYLARRHNLNPDIISQQSTPEDWTGLRRYVEASSLPHRKEILQVIDDTLRRPDPDVRLRYIRRTYVQDFADIFDNSLPYLRHTDYTIRYTFGDGEELRIPRPPVAQLPTGPRIPNTPPEVIPPLRPLFAVKTNLINDLILWPNVEVEVPLGRDARWSIMAEWGSPWYVWHHNSRAYEILNVGIEGRRWLGKCPDCRPVLSGAFVGLYACIGKYDLEWNSVGNQGEYVSFGPSAGYSWVLSKCLNFELSATAGLIIGKRRHYRGEFDDTHLIWKHFGGVLYGGPTQLKASIVWLIPRKWFGLDKKKGGAL